MPNWLLSRRHFSSRMSGRAAIRLVHRRKSWLRLALVAVLGGLLSGDSIWWDRRVPRSAIEIFEGVTYGSARWKSRQRAADCCTGCVLILAHPASNFM